MFIGFFLAVAFSLTKGERYGREGACKIHPSCGVQSDRKSVSVNSELCEHSCKQAVSSMISEL
jgi:hypothetical protein